MARRYNLKNIRNLLTDGFTAKELRLFCYDNIDFRPVYDEIAPSSGKAEIIKWLIEYADRKSKIKKLLAWAKEYNSAKYEKHRPYYEKNYSYEELNDPNIRYFFYNIRTLLIEGFSNDELFSLCFDEPDFRPVYDQLSEYSGKLEIADTLIEYAQRTSRIDKLLTLTKERNPIRYAKHQPYFEIIAIPTATEEDGSTVESPKLASPHLSVPTSIITEKEVSNSYFGNYFGGQNDILPNETSRTKAITIFYNPYIAGPPITQPEMFFGRQTDLEKVIGLLKNNFVMLTGPRRIGKTSLLHQLAYQLSILIGPEKFIPVLVNIEGTLETEFFHLLMEEIVSTVQPFLPLETITTLSFDLSNLVYPARAFSRDLQTILKGLQTTTPLPSRLVLLLDEMDTLNSYSLETQSQLRRIFQRFTNTNLSIVVAGVKLRQQWAGESSPFYNMFIPVTLNPFPEAEARRLIIEPVQGRYIYQDEAIIRILQATSGLPHRIQQLCLEVINRVAATAAGRQEITVEDVDSILPTIQWLDEPTLAPDQGTVIVTAQPAIAEDKTEYHPTTSTSTDQEAK